MSSSLSRVLGLACVGIAVPAIGWAQTAATISGRVTGSGGQPVAGASVFIPALSIGTQTRSDGSYSFSVPAARANGQTVTLTARLLGYTPQSIQLALTGGTITQNFTLAQAATTLSAVVVTGAGTVTTQERLGNVRTAVDSTLIRRSNEVNVVNALAGKAANVQVTSQSGDPGASAYIRIRGLKTINGTGQPLIVVDGSPINNETISTGGNTGSTAVSNRLADLNPNDIENVEILKGAAAAAIYGARAGEGVIQITTKSGRAGQTSYQLRSNVSLDNVNREVPLQRSYGQGSGGVAPTCAAPGCRLASSSYGPKLTGGTATYDHSGELFETGTLYDNNLTVSGGSERTSFLLSGGYLDQDGIWKGPNSYYKRATARLKASHRLFSNFTLNGNFAFADTRQAGVQKGSNISGVFLGALRTPPEFDNRQYVDTITGQHRSYRYPRPTGGTASLLVGRGYDNPFFVINDIPSTQNVGRSFGNTGFDWTPFPWLTVRETLGADYSNDQRLEAYPYTATAQPVGQVAQGTFTNLEIDNNLTASATKEWNPSLSTTLTLGQNLNSRRFDQKFATGTALIAPTPYTLSNTQSIIPAPYTSLRRIEAYFAQGQLDLWQQLYLTGSVRADKFSTFGSNAGRNYFPRGAVSWVFSNLFNPANVFSSGKVRFAMGQTGIEPPVYSVFGNYTSGDYGDAGWGSLLTVKSPNFPIGGLYEGGTKPNPNLKPERQTELESGFDLSFLNDALTFGATYYNSTSTDVIFAQPVSSATGYLVQANNAGKIRNAGVELQLDYAPVRRANLRWDVGAVFAANRNRVLDLAGNQFIDLPSGGSFEGAVATAWKGSGVGVLRGSDFARCGVTADDVDDGFGQTIGAGCAGAPKGALYIAEDGYPALDPEQRVIANGNPKWTAGFRSSLRVRRFTLSGLLDVRHGGEVWNGTKGALYNFGTHRDTEDRDQTVTFGSNYKLGGHGSATFPVAGPGAGQAVPVDQSWYQGLGSGFGPVARQFVENGSFVKLRELALQYSASTGRFTRFLGVNSVDLRVAGRNLAVWTKYTGIDPETNLAGAEAAFQGIDYFNNPQTRSVVFTIGLNR